MGKRKVIESVKDDEKVNTETQSNGKEYQSDKNENQSSLSVAQRNKMDENKESNDRNHGENNNGQSVEFDAEKEFEKLYMHAIKMGLTHKDLARLTILQQIAWEGSWTRVILKYVAILLTILVVVYVSGFIVLVVEWPLSREQIAGAWMNLVGRDIDHDECIIDMPEFVGDVFRPPVECEFCKDLTKVETVYNITQEEFEDLYAYSGVPVVIGDGTANWTAPDYFTFEFFKEIYKEGSQALKNQENKCQFFPYKTSFVNLGEVLNMSPERARMEDGSEPWYIGWSNCDFTAANILRKHYTRPYFLPKLSESSKTDWMFMGSPGYGAHMHIDHVGNPSWQAQITGTKKWTLEPPPECYYTCPDRLEVIVHPGQIIVLDTDIWFHSTLNVGKDISITIGSEYD